MKFKATVITIAAILAIATMAHAQSSSLYLAEPTQPQRVRGRIVTPRLEVASYTAVLAQKPRQFAKHDLVTIIIRESSTATLESDMETEKESKVSGDVSAFPKLILKDLLEGRLRAGSGNDLPAVETSFKNEFTGEAEYERRDSLTTRLTARVMDVKPNGTLVLEGRTFIQNDDEKLTITLTGYCRAEDVNIDNTVLSTQMYDLRVKKVHKGELRKTTKKGILTKLLELVFNF